MKIFSVSRNYPFQEIKWEKIERETDEFFVREGGSRFKKDDSYNYWFHNYPEAKAKQYDLCLMSIREMEDNLAFRKSIFQLDVHDKKDETEEQFFARLKKEMQEDYGINRSK